MSCEDDVREADNEVHEFEEEARVGKILAEFVDDDDENDDYQRTPPPSDGEDEPVDNCYERWRKGSGELKIKQVFDSIQEFKEAVLEYALKGGWNIQYTKSSSLKCQVKCGVTEDGCLAKSRVEDDDCPTKNGVESPSKCGVEEDHSLVKCPWKIYCSYEESAGQWMVKTFQDVHTCFKDGRCKILSDSIIARLFLNDVRNDPTLKPKFIQEQIQERYDLIVSSDKCRKAKKKALDIIQGEFDEQYARIKDYEIEILKSNKDSTTELRTAIGDNGLEVFDRFYVCFAALREIWRNYCRPIFGIDGCFLKSTTKGQLLAAVGRDANNQIYPIAWAVVYVEDTESWVWFIEKLKTDLNLKNGDGFTVISDRQKGLLKAVQQELPKIEHRMCARHIYGNLKKHHPKKSEMKKLFWEVVESFTKPDYDASLAKVKEYDLGVFEALMKRNPETCSRAFFKTTSVCEDALNNFSESYNSAIDKARGLPLIEMLETMRRQTMIRIDQRKKKIWKHKSKFSLKVGKVIALEEKERKWCRTIPGPSPTFEVKESGISYKVNMKHKTCACRRWDLTGIPCRHALRVVMDSKMYKTEDLVSHWYLTSKWQKQYNDSIKPMNGMKFWKKSGEATIQPPEREISKGRKKNPQKRIKGVNESPTKGKKVTQHNRTMHCHRCGLPGHNSTKCKNGGVPLKPRPKKKAKTHTSEEVSMTLDFGESLSQPSQSSAPYGL